jgi:hypothetical protein
MGGITYANTRLIPAKVIEPITPLLIHPEVLKKNAWDRGNGGFASGQPL